MADDFGLVSQAKAQVAMDLPPELLYQIFGHLDDKETIDKALIVAPDIVRSVVRRIHSPRVAEMPLTRLVAFKRLERATNILVHVKEEDLDTLRPLSHLRGLCVEVHDVSSRQSCIAYLRRIFRVEDKRDDQLFVFRVRTKAYTVWDMYYHNSHCVAEYQSAAPVGFTDQNIYTLRPRPYLDLLQSTLPYLDDTLRRIVEI